MLHGEARFQTLVPDAESESGCCGRVPEAPRFGGDGSGVGLRGRGRRQTIRGTYPTATTEMLTCSESYSELWTKKTYMHVR